MKDTVILNSPEPATGVYLAKRIKSKVVHFWTGTDTVCRQWSAGAMARKDEYDIVTNTLGRDICSQCGARAIKLRLDV
jgi:hypothetical protein